MSYRVFADQIYSSDLTDKSCHQRFILGSNCLLLSIRLSLVLYNAPEIVGLRANIYSSRSEIPNSLLHTSENKFETSDISTEDNAVKEIFFEFKKPDGVKLSGLEEYCIVLSAESYTGNATSHIAWVKQWPTPTYRENFDPTFQNLLTSPRTLAFIGAKL